ncbi:hypothetical protein BDA99DRAFT_494220 [Phascolomyces articulosus]|uniref:PH domain-containing protein n=1 Tax=Phascolomyces articulosus TaxID=60185 RepID=A0AAD5KAZ4_9FUNG|nr:hypothetical protein BDA99DRAFT_494220 [Phascolomyces articulosus]
MTTVATAPPIPEKSSLRKQSTVSIDTSSITNITSATTPEQQQVEEPTTTNKSRYTEQFDLIPPPELLEALALSTPDNNDNNNNRRNKPSTTHKTLRPFMQSSPSSNSLTTNNDPTLPSPSTSTSRPPLSNAAFWSSSSISRSFSARNLSNHKLSDLSESEDNSSTISKPVSNKSKKQAKKKKSKLFGGSSKSTPTPKPSTSTSTTATATKQHHTHDVVKKEYNKEDDNTNGIGGDYVKTSGPRVPTIFSLNRAEVIITRLDYWQHLLKAVINWLEELVKISFQNSRCYSQRALPTLKEDIGDTSSENAMATVQAGLQMLSMQLATEEKDFGKKIQQDYLPGLIKLRKDAKEMIRGLKEEPELVMDELLRLAETTRKSMTQLNRYCKAAETYPVEHDPWLANLYVLRQLKHEIDEENRMRKLMVPIQKGTAAYEERVLEQLKPAIEFCYKKLAPGLWEGSEENDTPFKLVMEQLVPSMEWNSFFDIKKKDLVNEENPLKDYLKINYPNKLNPKVMTVSKGVLERRTGVLKQYTERFYVLSQCGYLHQFTMDDKVSPERSIYIPETTIIPSIDISHFGDNEKTKGPFTFEIHKRGTQVLQRDRTFYFRTNSREELVSWCRVLCDVSTAAQGTRMISAPIPMKQLPSDSASSSSVEGGDQLKKSNGSIISIPTVKSVRSNLTATPPVAQPKSPARQAAALTNNSTTTDTKTDVSDEKTQVSTATTAITEVATTSSSSTFDNNETVAETSNNTKVEKIADDTPPMKITDAAAAKAAAEQAKADDHAKETTETTTTTNGYHNDIPPASIADVDDDDDDTASIMTARAIPHESTSTSTQEEKKVEKEETSSSTSKKEEKRPAPLNLERPESRASIVTDSESSVYFSSTSGPPSPASSNGSVPDHHFDFPALQDNNNNNNRRNNGQDDEDDEPSTPKPEFYQPMLNFTI